MRIDKLKKLLAEIIADPGNRQLLARLCRNIGDELPRDDFGKLAKIRSELATARDDLEIAGPAAVMAALCDTLASYEASALKTVCRECAIPLQNYVSLTGERFCETCFIACVADAVACDICRAAVVEHIQNRSLDEDHFLRIECEDCGRPKTGRPIDFSYGTFRRTSS